MRKTTIILSILVSSLLVFLACEKETVIEPDITLQYPVAAFSFSGNDAPAPVTVQFYNHCETILPDSCNYLWTFGENGATSTLKEPTYTFQNNSSASKVFMVSLKVTDLVSNLSQTRSLAVEIQGSGK